MTWTPPDVTGDLLAALPWAASQAALAGAPLNPRAASLLACGWHGTATDPGRGAFAVVDAAGPGAGLVGHQVRVTHVASGRVVYVWVRAAVNDLVDDMTLTRRAFVELAPLWTTNLTVRVEATT